MESRRTVLLDNSFASINPSRLLLTRSRRGQNTAHFRACATAIQLTNKRLVMRNSQSLPLKCEFISDNRIKFRYKTIKRTQQLFHNIKMDQEFQQQKSEEKAIFGQGGSFLTMLLELLLDSIFLNVGIRSTIVQVNYVSY